MIEFEPDEDADMVIWLNYLDQEVIFEPEGEEEEESPDS